jgi:hypothetical protein
MPDETYRFVYDLTDKVGPKIDALMAKLTALDVMIGKTQQSLRVLGKDHPGLTSYVRALEKVDVELKSKVKDSSKAEKALKGVGTGNKAIHEMTRDLEKLEDRLHRVVGAAEKATATTGGVGGGAPGAPGSPAQVGKPGKGGAAGGGLLGTVATMTAIGMGTRAARTVGTAFADAQKGHREFLEESAGKSADFRESLREYASLRGKDGPDNSIVREATAFAKQGSVFPEEIAPFLTAYEGSSATGRLAGNIGGEVGKDGYTKQQQEALEAKVKVTGAQFGTRTGMDARTAGDLTGVITTYKKINSEVDVAGQLGGMHYGLDQGRGEISPLARSELAQAGSAIKSGRASGLPEVGAFIGVASVIAKGAGSSGTTYSHISRLLNEVDDGGDSKKAQFVRDSGMGAVKGDFAKLKALRDYIAKVKPDDVNAFLKTEGGFGNDTDRRDIAGTLDNVDVLEKRIAEAKRVAANGQEVIDKNHRNQTQMASVNRSTEVGQFANQVETGLMAEKLAQGMGKARERLMDPNQPGGQRLKARGMTIAEDAAFNVYSFGLMTGEQRRQGAEAVQGLVKGGQQVGVDVAARYPGLMNNLGPNPQSPDKFAYDYGQAAYAVEQAGGDPFGGAPRDAAKALRQIGGAAINAANALDAIKAPKGPVGPQPNKPGNAGAGVLPGRR